MHRSGAAMAWNVFKFCTALRGLGSIMILLVLGVVGVTYYAVVLTNYGPALYSGGLDCLVALAVLIPFHFLLAMLLWSYFSVVFTDPGGVPPNWRPATDEERGEVDPLNGSEFNGLQPNQSVQRIRYCRKCNQPKPPRCHHCSVCGRCILKMDHHCVWVVNCVGALNYKYFLLFLFYTFLETTVVTVSLLPHFIAFFSDGEIPGTPGTLATTFLAFVLNLAFALSVLGFLILHISLVAANTTTIEAYEKKTTPKWRYDLGRRRNFEQVLYSQCPLSYDLFITMKLDIGNYVLLGLSNGMPLVMQILFLWGNPGPLEMIPLPSGKGKRNGVTCFNAVKGPSFFIATLLFVVFYHCTKLASGVSQKFVSSFPWKKFFLFCSSQVFGAEKKYWLVPTYSDEDIRRMPALQGLEYPSKPEFDAQEF